MPFGRLSKKCGQAGDPVNAPAGMGPRWRCKGLQTVSAGFGQRLDLRDSRVLRHLFAQNAL